MHCLLLLPLFGGVLCLVLVLVFRTLCPSSIAISLIEKKELCYFTLIVLIVTVSVLWLFLMESCVGLQCVIMVFPDHTHLLIFGIVLF